VPYRTSRAGKQAGALGEAAERASYAYERSDGSGYFRGARDQSLTLEANVLAASVTFVALRSIRPWRVALSAEEAAPQPQDEATRGRRIVDVVDTLLSDDARVVRQRVSSVSQSVRPTAREIDVLRVISRGASNTDAARKLTLSPARCERMSKTSFASSNAPRAQRRPLRHRRWVCSSSVPRARHVEVGGAQRSRQANH
jgi:hypothetical protein